MLLHNNIDVDDTNKYQMKHQTPNISDRLKYIPYVNANFLTNTFGRSLPV